MMVLLFCKECGKFTYHRVCPKDHKSKICQARDLVSEAYNENS